MRPARTALLAVVLALGLASCREPTEVQAGDGDAVGAPERATETTTTSEWRSEAHELECAPNEKYLWSHNVDIIESGIDRSDPDGASPENAIRHFLGTNDKVGAWGLDDEVPAAGISRHRKPDRGFYQRPSDMAEARRYGYSRGSRLQLVLTVTNYDGYWITTGATACNGGITG